MTTRDRDSGEPERSERPTKQLANVIAFDAKRGRPDPPADLTEDEAQEWREIVRSLPPHRIKPEHFAIFSAYCRHICRSSFFSRLFDAARPQGAATGEALDRLVRLADAALRADRAVLACATKLRFIPSRCVN